MAFLILGALELITYFLFGIRTFESRELFILTWGLITLMIFITSVFKIQTYDMNRTTKTGFINFTNDTFVSKIIYSSIFINLQYLLLVLINVVLYIVMISPHY
jgi:hypothetical protein